MSKRTHRSIPVNQVRCEDLVRGRAGQNLIVGVDVGKYEMWAALRWGVHDFEPRWRLRNPGDIGEFVRLLQRLQSGRQLRVALEPSGSYGDALRQALADQRIETHRVSPKAAHDYAEVFDGVPSQHDGKDAAVIAELAAQGKSALWPYQPADDTEQELRYWVDELDCQGRLRSLWLGRIEALLARYWPEATQVVPCSSGTLLRALAYYGGPAALRADAQAEARLRGWGGHYLKAETARALVVSAAATVGVRPGAWECRQLREHAEQALAARRAFARSRRRLAALGQGHTTLPAMASVVSMATACVLWVCTGDPRTYASGAAYRKALGLNLAERSSGMYQGKLKISKRGSSRSRHWLYLAALRLVQRAGVRRWYEAKKARDGGGAKRAVVAVMRKLALAVHSVATRGTSFDPQRLFRRALAQQRRRQRARSR